MEARKAGWQTYIVIERNIYSESAYFSSGCNHRVPTLDVDGNIVALNGVIFISTSYGVFHPHYSYANLIALYPNFVGYALNLDTGELRFYDGTQVLVTDFWTAQQRAIAKCQKFDLTNKRTLDVGKELGQMMPFDLKALGHEYDLTIDKAYSRKRNKYPVAPSRLSPVLEQFGFLGPGVVERDTLLKLVQPDLQDYYLVFLYTWDASGDANHIADTVVLPCVKFEQYDINPEVDKVTPLKLVAKSTYGYTIPFDHPNIEDYTPST